MFFSLFADLRRHPKTLWVLFFATLINRMGTMVLPFLVLYVTTVLKLSAGQAGLLVGLYGVGGLVTNFFGGALGDRFGAVRVIIVGLLASAGFLFLLPHATDFNTLILLVVLWSLFSESTRAANMAAVGQFSHPDLQLNAYAVARLAVNLGMSIGPIVGGFLARDHFKWLFYIDGITSIIAALLLLRYAPAGVPARTVATVKPSKYLLLGGLKALADRKLVYINLVVLPITIAYAQLDSSFPLFVVGELGHTEKFYGLLYCLNAIVITLVEVPLSVRLTKTSMDRLMLFGGLAFACGLGLFALRLPPVLIAGMLMFTIGEMLVFPTTTAYISKIAPEGSRSTYMGVSFASWSLCGILGPIIGTWTVSSFGSSALWVGLACFVLLTSIVSRNLLQAD